jgi:hypothetical protein
MDNQPVSVPIQPASLDESLHKLLWLAFVPANPSSQVNWLEPRQVAICSVVLAEQPE